MLKANRWRRPPLVTSSTLQITTLLFSTSCVSSYMTSGHSVIQLAEGVHVNLCNKTKAYFSCLFWYSVKTNRFTLTFTFQSTFHTLHSVRTMLHCRFKPTVLGQASEVSVTWLSSLIFIQKVLIGKYGSPFLMGPPSAVPVFWSLLWLCNAWMLSVITGEQ